MPNYLSDYVLTAQTPSPSSFHEAMQSVEADILTKALPKTRFRNLRRQSGIIGRFKYRSFKNGIINANASKILNCTEVRKLLGGVDPISPLTPPTFSQKN
ncbi:hypothetical protein T08_5933 [Trichinella sp. T8]|nr:hypothetical protein T08_5933 [Trichinella sp. T8]